MIISVILEGRQHNTNFTDLVTCSVQSQLAVDKPPSVLFSCYEKKTCINCPFIKSIITESKLHYILQRHRFAEIEAHSCFTLKIIV